MQPEKIVIADICLELRKLAGSEIIAEYTAESCRQAAFLLEKMREAAFSYIQPPEAMSQAEAGIALGENLRSVMVQQGEG